MSSFGRLLEVSPSGQLTFLQLIPPSEETSSSGCTHFMSRPQWSKINFRFGALDSAERTAEHFHRFCEMTRVNTELIDACRGSDLDCTANRRSEYCGCLPMLGCTY